MIPPDRIDEHRALTSLLPVSGHRAKRRRNVSSATEKPNLEYLKKQAKELLRTMGQGKLADAQQRSPMSTAFPPGRS